MLIMIPLYGNVYLIPIWLVKAIQNKYDSPIPIGIPIIKDLVQQKKLSRKIILLNSLDVIPTLFKVANSLLLNEILVVIVLNILVTPIKAMTIINPYRNIAITVYRD